MSPIHGSHAHQSTGPLMIRIIFPTGVSYASTWIFLLLLSIQTHLLRPRQAWKVLLHLNNDDYLYAPQCRSSSWPETCPSFPYLPHTCVGNCRCHFWEDSLRFGHCNTLRCSLFFARFCKRVTVHTTQQYMLSEFCNKFYHRKVFSWAMEQEEKMDGFEAGKTKIGSA